MADLGCMWLHLAYLTSGNAGVWQSWRMMARQCLGLLNKLLVLLAVGCLISTQQQETAGICVVLTAAPLFVAAACCLF
jgi:hypothetical protein